MPVGGVTQPEMTRVESGQFVDPRTGQLVGTPTATAFVQKLLKQHLLKKQQLLK